MQKLARYRGSRVSINWGNARRGRRVAVSFSAPPRQGLINTKVTLCCHSPARPRRKASMGISVPVALGGRGTGTQQSSCFLLGLRELTNAGLTMGTRAQDQYMPLESSPCRKWFLYQLFPNISGLPKWHQIAFISEEFISGCFYHTSNVDISSTVFL